MDDLGELGEQVFDLDSVGAVVNRLFLWLGLGLLGEEGLPLLRLGLTISSTIYIGDTIGHLARTRTHSVGGSVGGPIGIAIGGAIGSPSGGAIGIDGSLFLLVEAQLGGKSPEHLAGHFACRRGGGLYKKIQETQTGRVNLEREERSRRGKQQRGYK